MTYDQHQLPLFSGHLAGPSAGNGENRCMQIVKRPVKFNSPAQGINPHLLAARRIAKRMRRLPDRSDAETRAGLAICAQLKGFLADEAGPNANRSDRDAPRSTLNPATAAAAGCSTSLKSVQIANCDCNGVLTGAANSIKFSKIAPLSELQYEELDLHVRAQVRQYR